MEQINSEATHKKVEVLTRDTMIKIEDLSLEPIVRIDNSDENLKSNKILNINIGVLGHIDSGKTSLCKALSTIASTAGFDKNP